MVVIVMCHTVSKQSHMLTIKIFHKTILRFDIFFSAA